MNTLNQLDILRKRLVDTGTRNRLIHVNRNAKRANVLNIVRERSNDIYDMLRVKERKMRFRANDENETDPELRDFKLLQDNSVDSSRYSDIYLETELGTESLEKRLLKLKHDSDIAEEEQGANFLFLAMGFLRWYEDEKLELVRESPLVLLPVQISRHTRGFTLSVRSDDVTTNLPIQERLKNDFGVVLPDIDDSEEWAPEDYYDRVADVVDERKRWSIDRDGMQLGFFSFAKALMYRDLDEENWPKDGLTQNPLIQGLLVAGLSIENTSLKFGPQDRLDEHLDPGDMIHVVEADSSQTKVIEEVRSGRNLVVQGPPGTGKSQTITNIIATAAHDGKTVLFMAEKMAALKVVHDRLVKVELGDLCLELHSRTANKKAFYEELKRTLDAGRGVPNAANSPKELTQARDELNAIDTILHMRLEERDYSPFDVIAEQCHLLGRNVPPPRLESEELAELTNQERDEIGQTVRAFAEVLKATGPPLEHPYFGVRNLDLQPIDLSRLEQELKEASYAVSALMKSAVPIAKKLEVAAPLDIDMAEQLEQCMKKAWRAPEGIHESGMVFTACNDIPRLMVGLGLFKTWRDAQNAVEDKFADKAWNAPVKEMRPQILTGLGSGLRSFFVRRFGKYRRTSTQFATLLKGQLPRSPGERLALMDTLIDVQDKRRSLEEEEYSLSTSLGSFWRGRHTDVETLLKVGAWVADLRDLLCQIQRRPIDFETINTLCKLKSEEEALPDRLHAGREELRHRLDAVVKRLQFDPLGTEGLPSSLEKLQNRLERMRQVQRYEEWRKYQELRQELENNDLGGFSVRIEGENTLPTDAEQEFLYAVVDARWKYTRSIRPELSSLRSEDRHSIVDSFQNLERSRMNEVRTIVRSQHLNQLPTGTAGEMAFLLGECAKSRRHKPVRQAFLAARNMIQRIKPVILMSPISIAQFLPPGEVSFDLLLIDEASQVRPEDALGAVARAKQIVVVGDDKQLPPTSFFDRLVDNTHEDGEEEDAPPAPAGAAEMESILKVAEIRGLGQAMLEWHYRSRDPSLIKMSNIEFYENRLVLQPSPLEKDDYYGMKLTRVDGVYSSRSRGDGRPGTNRIEAERIADELVKLAGTPDRQGQSVGVVAFSKAQSDMINEVLEMRRRVDSTLDALLREDKNENVFVKNIENVQGDERDVILVSVGYGPQEPNGRLSSMRFGPINNEGGERRLNVLFSRARMRCEIFVSFDWREIDLTRTQAYGPRMLRTFLEFAETGQIGPVPASNDDGPESPLEEDVALVIEGFGYPVDHQVGSSGFRIDLGVRDPERPSLYILAVECDGATYHSALWARERDRLRQDVLEHQGWRFHRIWSTDWFHRRENEIERLRTTLNAARDAAERGFSPPAANKSSVSFENSNDSYQSFDGPSETHGTSPELFESLRAPAYKKADVTYVGNLAPHELWEGQMKNLVNRIIEQEGPIHKMLVARRVAEAFGLSRTGSRIVKATFEGLKLAIRSNEQLSGDFVMTSEQHTNPPVRNRTQETAPVTTPAYLPPIEICAAVEWVERENGVVRGQEQIQAVARLLGFQKVSSKLNSYIAGVLKRWR